MKKQTALALAAVFSLSVAGTALAAPTNPFVDVPAKHWAYDSVSKLAQAGVISGYGDGTYKGDRTMTRYEMAAIIGKALANSDKADAELKKELDALQAEFSVELDNLGVRVDNLEKKMSNIKFTGEVRSRYDWQDDYKGYVGDRTGELTRLRLNMEAEVAKNVTFHGQYESESDWGTSDTAKLSQAYIAGKLGSVGYSFGRQPLWLGQGLIADVNGGNDGLVLSGGKNVKVAVAAFKKREPGVASAALAVYDENFYAADINAKLSGNLNVSVSYLKDKDSEFYKTYSAGLNYTGIKNFTVSGEYGQNDAEDAKQTDGSKAKAWMAKLQYAGAKKDKVGSYGIWAGYRNADDGFDPADLTTLDAGIVDAPEYSYANNVKGAEFGVEYTVFKNGIFTVQYNDLELKDTKVNNDRKSFFAHLTYSF